MFFNIFRSEIPYLQYEIFKDYIAKNLCVNRFKKNCCCHGKCFLAKQVKVVADTDDNEKNKDTPKAVQSNKDASEFILIKQNRLPCPVEVVLTRIYCPIYIVINKFPSDIFVPPKYNTDIQFWFTNI
ncbi:MAG: hypothetical protein P4L28_04360 [Paludibacteraceae bacterium]|nr:hypothetical protein [Paludibacteraceae bacterium]